MTATSFIENLSFSPQLIQYVYEHENGSGSHPGVYQVLSRIGFAANIPLNVAACPLDAAFGFTASALSFLTLGTSKGLYTKARVHLLGFGTVISVVFGNVLYFINPHSEADHRSLASTLNQYVFHKKVFAYINKDSFIDRQVKSRLLCVVSLIGTVIARIIDLVIGIIALPFALLAAPFASLAPDTIKKLNGFAVEGLKILSLFDDIYKHLIHIINPYAGFYLHNEYRRYLPLLN